MMEWIISARLWPKTFFWFATLLLLLRDISRAVCLKNVKITVPEAVAVGDTVTLSCHYDLEADALYLIRWYLDSEEFYRYVPKEEPPARVFEISGISVNINKSNANLVTLRSVTRNQTGTYQCEVSADAPSFHTETAQATMLVAVLPEAQPSMTVNGLRVLNNKILVRMDESLKMICTSSPSYPPVNFTWSINGIPHSSTHTGFHSVNGGQSWETREAWSELVIHINYNLVSPYTRRLIVRCETNIYTLYRGAAVVELDLMEDNPWSFGEKVSPTMDQRSGSGKGGDPDNSALTGSAILLGGCYKCFIFRTVVCFLVVVLMFS
ncbi:uncharacterized protein LOC132257601 [Phlebotomus argentipes]|uniref:uncharacterized protein LOC132257601 n=1 Tax=Phlebotomus argentipes TaxID=94469 RepID=UPI002892EF94|nr:uncharacterized protein LOC132257601 [Phlebotomus argentipes]